MKRDWGVEATILLRRIVCALAPDWHPGWVRVEFDTTQRIPAGSYSLTPARSLAGRTRLWSVPICVRCGEPESW